MATTTGLSYEELFHPAFITGLIQRYSSGNNFFQRLFNMKPGDAPTETVSGKVGQLDLVDPTRSIGGIRANAVGPHRVIPKSVGESTVTCYRYYEAIDILDEKMFPVRPLGGPLNVVEPGAKSHFAQQVAHLGERMSNLREFAISRMLFGGFSLKRINDNDQNVVPVELGTSGAFKNIASGLPTGHKDQLNVDGAGDLIGTTWGTGSSADIASDVYKVNEKMMLKSGMPLRHVIITTPTYNAMRANSKLQSQGGTVQSPMTDLSPNGDANKEGDPNGGFTVRFRAMPQFLFHVYDGFLMLDNDSTDQQDQRDATKVVKVMEDNKALFLPEPSSRWFGWQAGSEPVKKNIASVSSEIVTGFDTWDMPINDPPGRQLRAMDIGLPYLKMRESIFYATCIF